MKARDYAAEKELLIEGQRLGMRRQMLYDWVWDELYGDHEDGEPIEGASEEEPEEAPVKKAKKKAKKKTTKKSSKG